ncbi:MAG: peptidase [Thermomicrobiales bacterium]|nr:peptidase [Thermomicrobiales bacterium]
MRIIRLVLSLLIMLAGALPGVPATADDYQRPDHDRARTALREGRVLPLEEIMARANADFPGEVLDVEFEEEHGRFLYEIKKITTDGRIMKLEYDAATGALLKTEGRDRAGR